MVSLARQSVEKAAYRRNDNQIHSQSPNGAYRPSPQTLIARFSACASRVRVGVLCVECVRALVLPRSHGKESRPVPYMNMTRYYITFCIDVSPPLRHPAAPSHAATAAAEAPASSKEWMRHRRVHLWRALPLPLPTCQCLSLPICRHSLEPEAALSLPRSVFACKWTNPQ